MDSRLIESIVTFKWHAPPGYRTTFEGSHVNTLFRMCRRWYPYPFRSICITDDSEGIDPSIEVVPLWEQHGDIPNPSGRPGKPGPSCYRRLRMFDPAFKRIAGDRFAMFDLDMVITGDLTPILSRAEDLVLCQNFNPQTSYNGSMVLMTAGARPQVWTDFDPEQSPKLSHAAKQFGSDQGWVSYVLGPHEATWTTADGVYSYRNHLKPKTPDVLPEGCRVVVAHGQFKPWGEMQKHGWCREHYI